MTNVLIHNRLNYKYTPVENISFCIELRNRLTFGDNITFNPDSYKSYEKDNGWFDASFVLAKGKSYILSSNADRLYVSFEKNNLKITAGRQRINWGQTLVWNPNDIFNTYSFLDFDYIERPGSDAIRIQYYNNEVTTTELAAKLNSKNELTLAGLYRFNTHEYDIQFLGGILDNSDYIAGIGWSGFVGKISFRGEATLFQPKNKFLIEGADILSSASFDYTLSNSLMILVEYLYTTNNEINDTINILKYYEAPLSVKNLSFVKHNCLIQLSYPFTPLLNGYFAFMYMPKINGYYFGPTISYSVSQNSELSFFLQSFGLNYNNFMFRYYMLFLRFKYNF